MGNQKVINQDGPIISGKPEAVIQQEVRLEISKNGAVAFRNNVGTCKSENGRIIHFGLCKGSSDLIGWKSIEITPDMVGKKIAVFMAIECKAFKKNPTPEQANFIRVVKEAGGISGIARSASDAKDIIND